MQITPPHPIPHTSQNHRRGEGDHCFSRSLVTVAFAGCFASLWSSSEKLCSWSYIGWVWMLYSVSYAVIHSAIGLHILLLSFTLEMVYFFFLSLPCSQTMLRTPWRTEPLKCPTFQHCPVCVVCIPILLCLKWGQIIYIQHHNYSNRFSFTYNKISNKILNGNYQTGSTAEFPKDIRSNSLVDSRRSQSVCVVSDRHPWYRVVMPKAFPLAHTQCIFHTKVQFVLWVTFTVLLWHSWYKSVIAFVYFHSGSHQPWQFGICHPSASQWP